MERDFFGSIGAGPQLGLQIAAEDGVGPGPGGEDLGGESPDVQAPRTFESRTWSKKISGRFEEDLVD